MSLSKFIPSLLAAVVAVGFMAPRAEAQVNLGSGLVINKVSLTNPQLNGGVLTAAAGTVEGTLAGLPFTTDISNFALQLVPGATAGQDCSVLDLTLAPIHLQLLGLHADTSAICLNITAIRGGGLLGDLLCGLAGGLNLGDLTGSVNALLNGLPEVLNGALAGAAASPDAAAQPQAGDICTGDVEVLHLALGPIDLTLLGLEVMLDNCADPAGPVEVCLSATASEGLLGSLLSGLAGGGGGLLGNLGVVEGLVGAVTGALGNHTLTPKQTTQLTNRLVSQLTGRLQDGALSTKDLARVTKTVNQVVR
jgi:hypothetical protein